MRCDGDHFRGVVCAKSPSRRNSTPVDSQPALRGGIDFIRLNTDDVFVGKGGVCVFNGSGKVDRACSVFDDVALEAESGAVDGGVPDAEVVGEAGEEEPFQAALAEIAGQAGGGEVVVFEKGGVAVDVAAEAFSQNELGVGDVESGVEVGSRGVLKAVLGPEGLGAVVDLGDFEGLLVVGGGEGDVAVGMPVLGEDDVIELLGDGVDEGDDLVALSDGERASGHEIVLDVDDEEGVAGGEFDGHS